jgi:hypothetical protein
MIDCKHNATAPHARRCRHHQTAIPPAKFTFEIVRQEKWMERNFFTVSGKLKIYVRLSFAGKLVGI